MNIKCAFFVYCLMFCVNHTAQQPLTRVLFILDASNSMNSPWDSGTRMRVAKDYLSSSIEKLREVDNLEIALRVYGHQSPITSDFQDCSDTKLEVPFSKGNIDKIKSKIKFLEAQGATPIARSLEAAAEDFPDTNARNVIILITDGLESCDNDPCEIAKKLKDKGVNVTPFVIGVGMDLSYLQKFNCIGTYLEASTSVSFKNTLSKVIEKALINTTTQVNLNDIELNPTETDVSMLFYKSGTKELKYTIVHTINRYGNPDTLIIDPSISYDLVVNTIPKIIKSRIKLKRHVHNTIDVNAPQGFIEFKGTSKSKLNVLCRVTESSNDQSINVQKISSRDKYIVGHYNVEILTLPRIYMKANVKQGKTAILTIKSPGNFIYQFTKGVSAQLFVVDPKGALNWVCNFDPNIKSGDLILQPGTYKIVYRELTNKSSVNTQEQNFKIASNKTTNIKI